MDFFIHVLVIVMLYSSLAATLTVLVGHAGLFAMTHAAFYGIGAYSTALLTVVYDYGFIESVIIGSGISFFIATLVGSAMSRVKSEYYALASFGFMVVVFSILHNWSSVTKGVLGISGVPRPMIGNLQLKSDVEMLFVATALFFIVAAITFIISRSHFGRILRSIRDEQSILPLFGYNPAHYKMIIFTVTAVLVSITGSVYASYISFVTPSSFTLLESIFIMTIIILGGVNSIRGAFVGSLILVSLPELLRFVDFSIGSPDQLRLVIYGLVLVMVLYFKPTGLFGSRSI